MGRIILKNTKVGNVVPSLPSLFLGELFVNTNDGKWYYKKFPLGTTGSIEQLVSTNTIVNGNILVDGYISASTYYGDGSNLTNLPISDPFPFTGSAQITGSLGVTGSVSITGSFTASGLNYPTIDGEDGTILMTDGEGNLTLQDNVKYVTVKNVSGTTLVKGTPVHANGTSGNSPEVIAASASVASTMPATFVLAENLADEAEGRAILTGFINGINTSNGFIEGDVLYIAPDGGYTPSKPTGTNLIQNIAIIGKVDAVNGSIFVYGSGRSNDVPNLLEGQIFFGSGSNQAYQVHISGALDETVINNITASGNISASGDLTAESGKFTDGLTVTGSLIVSGSSTLTNIGPAIFKGSGTTSATTALLVEDSAGTDLLKVEDGGNVGIGTASPSYKLHVNGTVWGSTLYTNLLSVGNEGKVVSTSILGLQLQATAGSKPIIFYTNVGGNTERMRITPDGDVGIGQTSPSARLNVKGSGTTNATTALLVEDSSGTDLFEITDDGTTSLKGNTEVTGSLGVTGSVTINLDSGSAFEVKEPDSDIRGRLSFEYSQGDPTLSIKSRASTATLKIIDGSSGTGLDFTEDGVIRYNETNGVVVDAGSFKPVNNNQTSLGVSNRQFTDIFADGNFTDNKNMISVAGSQRADGKYNGGLIYLGFADDGAGNPFTSSLLSPDLHYFGIGANNSFTSGLHNEAPVYFKVGKSGSLSINLDQGDTGMGGDSFKFHTGSAMVHVEAEPSWNMDLFRGDKTLDDVRFRVDREGNTTISGSVGIGTTSPSDKLDVVGDIAAQGIYVDRTHEFGGISDPFAKFGLHYLHGGSNDITLQKTGRTQFIRFGTQTGYFMVSDGTNQIILRSESTPEVSVASIGALNYIQHAGTNNNNGNVLTWQNSTSGNGERGRVTIVGDLRLDDYSSGAASNAVNIENNGDAYFSGSVGIGTSSPSQKLTVEGNVELGTGGYIYGDTTTPYVRLNNAAGADLAYGATNKVSVGGPITITTSAVDVARWRNTKIIFTQPLFIGTSNINDTPTSELQVKGSGTTSATTALLVQNSSGTDLLKVEDGGDVGIGTTSPESVLHISDANPQFILEDTTNPNKSRITNVDGNLRYEADYNSDMGNSRHIFFIDNSEKVRFDVNGNVGIGTSSPAEKLTVEGNISASGEVVGSGASFGVLDLLTLPAGTGNDLELSGNAVVENVSSKRFKTDIKDYNVDLEELFKLQAKEYKFKTSEQKDIGFIAEEANEVYPHLITKDKKDQVHGFRYKMMVPLLLEGMKEMQKQINSLKEEIRSLKNT